MAETFPLGSWGDAVRPLIGLPVSHVWRGYGTALFLELGRLREYLIKGRVLDPKGEATVMIQWSWRIERPRSVFVGSWDRDRAIDARIGKLTGRAVTSVYVTGRLPELVVELAGGVLGALVHDGRGPA